MYLIDTNVISEARKRDRANQGVRDFFANTARFDSDMYISVVTVGELRRGVALIRHRGDVAQATVLEEWLNTTLNEFANKMLAIDEDVAQLWGHLRTPYPEHALDKLIAATALIHDLTVVTRNTDDFIGTGVRLLNPFN